MAALLLFTHNKQKVGLKENKPENSKESVGTLTTLYDAKAH